MSGHSKIIGVHTNSRIVLTHCKHQSALETLREQYNGELTGSPLSLRSVRTPLLPVLLSELVLFQALLLSGKVLVVVDDNHDDSSSRGVVSKDGAGGQVRRSCLLVRSRCLDGSQDG